MLDSHPIETKIHRLTSRRLRTNHNWRVHLSQTRYPDDLIGCGTGTGIYTGQADAPTRTLLAAIEAIPEDANIAVLSELPGYMRVKRRLQTKANHHDQIIVARLGYHRSVTNRMKNSVAVFAPGRQAPVIVDQISLSVEDIDRGTVRGSTLHFFGIHDRLISVINCHDYTHATIIDQLQKQGVDLIIIPTFNPATRLFDQYASGDIHRLFSFIIISNISNYGGSGVYTPFRRIGPRNHGIQMRGALATSRGPCEQATSVDLPIADLKRTKAQLFGKGSIVKKQKAISLEFMPPVVPPESALSKAPHYRKVIKRPNSIRQISFTWPIVKGRDKSHFGIAVAHLKSLHPLTYAKHRYHISSSDQGPRYIDYVKRRIETLADDLRAEKRSVEFLVFPEVFLPLSLEPVLRKFAAEFGAVVIGGWEYNKSPRHPGRNRCKVIVPGIQETKVYTYSKLTRSQYDARKLGDDGQSLGGEFRMDRGNELLVFESDLVTFGVLICYDYSHFDLAYHMNGAGKRDPLDVLFVIAHNPDSELYRQCCLSDSHRFYQYIVMCNVAQFGGSGVFGPVKTEGQRQTLLSAGQNVEGISIATVDLSALLGARRECDEGKLFLKKPGLYCIRAMKTGQRCKLGKEMDKANT